MIKSTILDFLNFNDWKIIFFCPEKAKFQFYNIQEAQNLKFQLSKIDLN